MKFDKTIGLLEAQIKEINRRELDQISQLEQTYNTINTFIAELRKQFLSGQLSTAEEIYFFKKIKPIIQSKQIVAAEQHRILLRMPFGRRKVIRKYLETEQRRIELFFDQHLTFLAYYKNGLKDRDEHYFLRTDAGWKVPIGALDYDPEFGTYYSTLVAKIIASEELYDWLNAQMGHSTETSAAAPGQAVTLKWTDHKIKLIELGYSIHAMGVCGNADVKQIMQGLESLFDIRLGNYYNAFLKNIRLRKKNATVFLDELKASLLRRLEDLDDNPRYG